MCVTSGVTCAASGVTCVISGVTCVTLGVTSGVTCVALGVTCLTPQALFIVFLLFQADLVIILCCACLCLLNEKGVAKLFKHISQFLSMLTD